MFTALIVLAVLTLVIALVAWSLHLMQEAFVHQEFSLMLAGCLVAIAAAAIMAVYFMMGNYIGYVSELAQHPYLSEPTLEANFWVNQTDELAVTWPASLPIDSQLDQVFSTID